MLQIRNALNLYASDHGGTFPGNYGSSFEVGGDWSVAFKADLAPYLSNIPKDPRNGLIDSGAGENYYAYWKIYPDWKGWSATCINHIVLYAYPAESAAIRHDECGTGVAFSYIIQ